MTDTKHPPRSGKILIFLDIDGVLLPFPTAEESTCGGTFPDETLAALSDLLEAHPTAELILSSTWRVQAAAIAEITSNLSLYGKTFGGPLKHNHQFSGTTDPNLHTGRQQEIANFLDTTDDKVAAWIALDDEELVEGAENIRFRSRFVGHVIKTNSRSGLTKVDAKGAIQLLNNQLGISRIDAATGQVK